MQANDRTQGLSTADLARSAHETEDERAETRASDERPGVNATASGRDRSGPGDGSNGVSTEPLFELGQSEEYQARWKTIQSQFVDDPRQAVQQADQMTAEIMQRLAELFSQERADLEQQWSRGDQVSTEDLRVALQRYRSFFQRLLSA